MKKNRLLGLIAFLLWSCLNSCNSANSSDKITISSDSATIAKGEKSFYYNCSSCHNFKQDGIGPQLGGITEKVSADWIESFIKNPQIAIASGDKRANELIKKYKVVMPSFDALQDDEIEAIISFLHRQKNSGTPVENENGVALSNPISQRIALSNLQVNLMQVAQIPQSADQAPKARITKLSPQPNTGDLFVNDLRGKLYRLKNYKPVVYMDIAKLKPKFINEPGLATGFGSFAFHPDFTKNGLLYTTHTESSGSGKSDFIYNDTIAVALQWVLTEWKTEYPGATIFSGTGREMLRLNMVTGSHGVQEITFNPTSHPGDKDYGMLYIGVGDGGAVQMGYPFVLHGTETIWGSILRIDPAGRNSANGKYGIPTDNPFVVTKNSTALPEIYAYGFRNPHRISWSKSGQMLASNIGQANIESLDLIKPGNNYGWPRREGRFLFNPNVDLNKVYPLPSDDSADEITYPIAEFDHDDGNAISGGYEYTGNKIPLLHGKFLFGDIPSGRVFYIDIADVKQGEEATIREIKIDIDGQYHSLKEISEDARVDLHFGMDSVNELYILTKSDGKIYKLESAKIEDGKNQVTKKK